MESYRAVRLGQPAGIGNLHLGTAQVPDPGAGEITVRIGGASLNFRDGLVVKGIFPASDGLIPLSDGAGQVVAIGPEVKDFAVGDAVVSTFHPKWLDGHMDRASLDDTPGGPADGFACEAVTRPATHFTRAPRGWSHVEAATLTCAATIIRCSGASYSARRRSTRWQSVTRRRGPTA